jgi:hypothetical protein
LFPFLAAGRIRSARTAINAGHEDCFGHLLVFTAYLILHRSHQCASPGGRCESGIAADSFRGRYLRLLMYSAIAVACSSVMPAIALL